jgi:hypothetical protein
MSMSYSHAHRLRWAYRPEALAAILPRRRLVNPGAILLLEGLGKLKVPMNSLKFEPATFWLWPSQNPPELKTIKWYSKQLSMNFVLSLILEIHQNMRPEFSHSWLAGRGVTDDTLCVWAALFYSPKITCFVNTCRRNTELRFNAFC